MSQNADFGPNFNGSDRLSICRTGPNNRNSIMGPRTNYEPSVQKSSDRTGLEQLRTGGPIFHGLRDMVSFSDLNSVRESLPVAN